MRHKHADLIIAWANGAQIQRRDSHYGVFTRKHYEDWVDVANPQWNPSALYRIKPSTEAEAIMAEDRIKMGVAAEST